jgi:hypothetical protein
VVVEDHFERRIRKPADLLRCIVSCIEVTGLALADVAASATTTGLETDIVGAGKRLPHSLLAAVPGGEVTPCGLSASGCGAADADRQHRRGGSDLGLAERLMLSTDTCWPFVVAIALRQTSPGCSSSVA